MDVMKIEIELTEDQIKGWRDGEWNSVDAEQAAADLGKQIRTQLPKPKKRWRFYKGKFSIDEDLKHNTEGHLICPVFSGNENWGPDAYCFTREQLEEAFEWVFLRTHDQIAIIPAELVSRFLSNQEVKE